MSTTRGRLLLPNFVFRRLLLWFVLFFTALPSRAQLDSVLVPFGGANYKYLITKAQTIPRNYEHPTFDDSRWAAARAAFGTLSIPNTPPCPLNDTAFVKTFWDQSREILLRKRFNLPAGAQNVRVTVAIDNAVQVYFNGTDISGGIRYHDDCASATGDFTFSVPASLLRVGENVIAVRGFWQSGKSYLDIKVLGDIVFTITATAGPNGSIAPSGAVSVNYGANQTFTITPNAQYRVADVVVDGNSQGSITSYTFTNVTANHTISATFVPESHTITASAGANGTITPSGAVVVSSGTNQLFTFTPDPHYHVDSVFVDGVHVGAPASYEFTNVIADHSILVKFAIDTYVITATAQANGAISPSGSVIVAHGSSPTFAGQEGCRECCRARSGTLQRAW